MSFGNVRSALAVHCLGVVRMRCRIARAMSIANEGPEVEAVIAGNFAPALSRPVRRNNVVKTLA